MNNTPRQVAAQMLCGVHRGGWANLTAKKTLAGAGFSQSEKAFAAAIFYGCVERLVTLNSLLQPFIKKPVNKLDVEVRAVLQTGAYQLMYMNVPPSAAVNESVKLVRSMRKSSAAGMVNAVLRKVAVLPKTQNGPALPQIANEVERLCIYYSLSRPVAVALLENLGENTEQFLQASFEGKGISVRVNTLKNEPKQLRDAFLKKGINITESPFEECFFSDMAGGVFDDELFKEGLYFVQGAASQIACKCLEVESGHTVLDVCAAPGGKAASLYMQCAGELNLTACDIHKNRLLVMQESFDRLGINTIKLVENDAAVFNEKLPVADRVLCDVPCSGLGTIAKKPDIRYSNGQNFESLPLLQGKILATASRYVKKGGRLVYSTCTLRRQENADVVEEFLRNNSEFKLVKPAVIPNGALFNGEMMTILPNNCKKPYSNKEFVINDGFFVATLERM